MYKRSRNFDSFFVAGVQYHDGVFALGELKVGDVLELVPEFDNPYDPNAVAIYYQGAHLGYVPSEHNYVFSNLLYFGHNNVFECRVMQVDLSADPWKQLRVGIYLKDAR